MPLSFRHRLLVGLVALGTLPLAAALVALALFFGSAGSPIGPRAALDEIARSGGAMIEALDTAALDDSAQAVVRRHAETIAARTTLARRAESLSRWSAAWLTTGVLVGALLVVGVSLFLVRRWSRQLAAPVEELVDWTGHIERGEMLPAPTAHAGPPELDALRVALRDTAAALERARQQEVERERLTAFRETARRVAHEMRGPINAVELALRHLGGSGEGGEEGDEKHRMALHVVTEETGRLRRLADEFAEFGRLPEGPESEIDVTELIDSVLQGAVPASLPVRRDLARGVTVRGRYEALRRAVENVVRNAVEATDGRGIAVHARHDGPRILITISDHGSGVPVDDRARIFAPYVTTRRRGTGLGLAIAHQAVTAQGGTLHVEAAPDGGAAFVFTFPA
jgi:signal transduction histidine kinase